MIIARCNELPIPVRPIRESGPFSGDGGVKAGVGQAFQPDFRLENPIDVSAKIAHRANNRARSIRDRACAICAINYSRKLSPVPVPFAVTCFLCIIL